jgi:AcrR family transcriptional regulator
MDDQSAVRREERTAARDQRRSARAAAQVERIAEMGERHETAQSRQREARAAVMERVMGSAPPPADAVTPNTRARIQQVALEMFIEHGYDATSLREISERLGFTKAALYYHFKSKEEIISSLVDDRLAALEDLLEWAETQPRDAKTRREIVRRYSEQLYEQRHHLTMRFMERNPTAMKAQPIAEKFRARLMRVSELLCEPGDSLETRLKTGLAIFAMHASWVLLPAGEVSDEERQAAALAVALDLVERRS